MTATTPNTIEHHRPRTAGWVNPLLTGGSLYFHTTSGAGWAMLFDKGGGGLGSLWIDYGDGSAYEIRNASAGFAHDYADTSNKTIRIWSPDDWSTLWSMQSNGHSNTSGLSGFSELYAMNSTFDFSSNTLSGSIPNFSRMTNIQNIYLNDNSFTGSIPSFSNCTALQRIRLDTNTGLTGSIPSFSACTSLVEFSCANNTGLTGSMPSFNACTALVKFVANECTGITTSTLPSFSACTALQEFRYDDCYLTGTLPSFNTCTALSTSFHLNVHSFSGTLPTFAACTSLQEFYCPTNRVGGWSTYTAGCFSTQASLGAVSLYGSSFNATNINLILANLRTSSALGGRVGCTVDLSGGSNAAPTGQGLTDKAYLNGLGGWSVTTT
jgi:hypothetical protein